jgi:predicted nuclease of predicted toxin-antitoxin system
MRFLADESCDFTVVRALRNAGHDVICVSETAVGATDEAVIHMATDDNRILLTEDKDFGQLVYASGHGHSGVVLLRYRMPARAAISQQIVVLAAKRDLSGHFVVVQPGRIRIV